MGTVVSIADARRRLNELVELAVAGEHVIIQRRGEPTVVLVALRPSEENGKPQAEMPRERLQRAAAKLGNHFRLSAKQERRLAALAKKNKRGTLTPAEEQEMFDLLHEYGRLTVERAKALGEVL